MQLPWDQRAFRWCGARAVKLHSTDSSQECAMCGVALQIEATLILPIK